MKKISPVKTITTAEIAQRTKLDSSWTDGGTWKNHKGSKADMKTKDGTLARAIGTAGETARAKENTGTGMASPKNGKDRTDRTI